MEFNHLYLLSTYLKKWSFGENRISLNYSFCLNDNYVRNHLDMRIGSPLNMTNELLNKSFHRAKELIAAQQQENNNQTKVNIILVNESEIKAKVSAFLSKVLNEFNQNKRSQGKQRMISTRSLDFYYNDFEFEPLDNSIKFYVHLNRGVNKTNGDLWSNAADDLKLALAIKPEDIIANKHMASALKKLGQHKKALEHLKIYAESEDSSESLEALAVSYLNIRNYKAADEVLSRIEKKFPDDPAAQFGRAQIAYKQGAKFQKHLDVIFERNPEWLVNKIKSDWDYKLPDFASQQDNLWNAAIAARYLGFERPFDLTRKAFSDELPSYFNPEKGTIRFAKPELDAWLEMVNHYKIEDVNYHAYPDRLTKEELSIGKMTKSPVKKKKKESKSEVV